MLTYFKTVLPKKQFIHFNLCLLKKQDSVKWKYISISKRRFGTDMILLVYSQLKL